MKNTYDLVDSLGGLSLCVWVPAPLTTPLVQGDRKTEAARSIIQQGVSGVERLTGAAIKDFRVWRKDDSVSVIKFSVDKDKEAAFRQTTAEWLEPYIPGARLIGPKWYPVKADWIEVGLAMDTDSGKVSRSAMERFGTENGWRCLDAASLSFSTENLMTLTPSSFPHTP